MEATSSLNLFVCISVCVVLLFLVILAFWRPLSNVFFYIFYPRVKIIRGKIIDFKSKERTSIVLSEDGRSQYPITYDVFCVIIQNQKNMKEYSIEIPELVYEFQLNQHREFISKNISLFFINNYSNEVYNHFEIVS